MSFTSPVFLFAFLPLTVIVYQLARSTKLKNAVWIAAGLLFYAFGDVRHLPLLLGSCLLHYGAGRYLMARTKARRAVLLSCVALDLAVLAFYKVRGALPLGISFYTFQAISYVADTYKNPADGTKNLREALQYLTFFPQLTAGPFLKFSALRPYLDRRDVSWEKNAQGVRRFMCGLCKKVLLSTAAAKLADAMFSLASIDALGAWTGALGYCLQLYFDFSGYTDMALGLSLCFGIRLPENFNSPYLAVSVTDFWRRWHISLSGWFRDYVYIPLGGSRCSRARQVLNLFAVWSLTGIWHGANWTFLAWGLWFFVLLTAEKLWLGKALSRLPRVFGHVYALLAVLIGWIFFNSRSLPDALGFLRALVVPGTGAPDGGAWLLLCLKQYGLQLAVCFVLCTDLGKKLWQTLGGARAGRALRYAVLALVFFLSVLTLTGSGMQAFIYARF